VVGGNEDGVEVEGEGQGVHPGPHVRAPSAKPAA
jgi:hypothetical protein